jgi:hypothetical protein
MRPAISSVIAGALPRKTTGVRAVPAACCSSMPQRWLAAPRPEWAMVSLSPSRLIMASTSARSFAGKSGRATTVIAASEARPSGAKLPCTS